MSFHLQIRSQSDLIRLIKYYVVTINCMDHLHWIFMKINKTVIELRRWSWATKSVAGETQSEGKRVSE